MPRGFAGMLLVCAITAVLLNACGVPANRAEPSAAQTDAAMHGLDDVDRHPTWKNCESRCVVDGHPRCCEAGD